MQKIESTRLNRNDRHRKYAESGKKYLLQSAQEPQTALLLMDRLLLLLGLSAAAAETAACTDMVLGASTAKVLLEHADTLEQLDEGALAKLASEQSDPYGEDTVKGDAPAIHIPNKCQGPSGNTSWCDLADDNSCR